MFKNMALPFAIAVFLFSMFTFSSAQAQVLNGQITDEENNALVGAWVKWPGQKENVSTGKDGNFKIDIIDSAEIYLVAGCRGFQTDTFLVKDVKFANIELTLVAKDLADVHIVKRKQGSFISSESTIKTEVITQKELTKAACCDMSGCFETQGTVQPQTTNVLTNSKELRILGLSGVYNQVLMDGLPLFQGLTYTYGISAVPASIIDKIFVSKGANSVIQGFESISGQINVISKSGEKEPRLYANGYINNFGEKHLNANFSTTLGKEKKWASLFGIHLVQPGNKRDRDGDGFMDLPLLTRYSIFNRWNYGKENLAGWFTQLSFRATKENRIGGQRLFNLETDKGSSKVYGQTLEYFQPEFIAKTGYRFSAIHAVQSQISAFGQEQKSWFGTLQFKGKQQNLNVLVQHQWNLTESQTLTWGGSFKYQKLVEDISFSDTMPKRTFAGRFNTDLKVPGIFSEYSGKFLDEKITWIAGIRWDRHQTFGSYLTPRSMLKLDLFPNHTVRASVGTGWRQVNLFTENITLLASSRDLIFEEKLNPEKALNWGANYTCLLEREKVTGTFSIDFYQTRFTNQFFPDFESRRGKAIIRNFGGNSVSNGFQAETNLKINEIWEFKTVYNYVEVYREEAKGKFILPFNPTHRVMTALSYRPINGRIFIDLNAHWFGKQNLPSTQGENGELGPEFSKPFATFNGQVTWIWRNLEWYGGIENILDFRQRQPIVGWQNPFGPNFDTATVWGPTRGRELYMGIRWRMD